MEPEPASDQAKVKFWRDRALYAEARLAEHNRQARPANLGPELEGQGSRGLDRMVGASSSRVPCAFKAKH